MPRYHPAAIEPKWQAYWEQQQTFVAPRLPEGEKLYVLDMFPYPSGSGLGSTSGICTLRSPMRSSASRMERAFQPSCSG